MTEQEQLLDMLQQMSMKAKEDRLVQLQQSANLLREMYVAYVNAGFTPKQSLELCKTMLIGAAYPK